MGVFLATTASSHARWARHEAKVPASKASRVRPHLLQRKARAGAETKRLSVVVALPVEQICRGCSRVGTWPPTSGENVGASHANGSRQLGGGTTLTMPKCSPARIISSRYPKNPLANSSCVGYKVGASTIGDAAICKIVYVVCVVCVSPLYVSFSLLIVVGCVVAVPFSPWRWHGQPGRAHSAAASAPSLVVCQGRHDWAK